MSYKHPQKGIIRVLQGYYRVIVTVFIIVTTFLLMIRLIGKESDAQTQSVINPEPNIATETDVQSFNSLLSNQYNAANAIPAIHQLVTSSYNQSYLNAQQDMLTALTTQNLDVEETSHLFLPLYPSQYTESTGKQLDIPLLLQKNQNWRSLSYGTDETKELGENGCAILTLAMLESYYTNSIVSPQQILNWSKNDYYLHNQGTSWQIFHNYALTHNYQFENLSSDFNRAMAAVQEGKVVIVSVKPGYFTTVGHILIIRGYDGKNVYVNDPNDDVNKMYSLKGIDSSVFLSEALNYWAIYK